MSDISGVALVDSCSVVVLDAENRFVAVALVVGYFGFENPKICDHFY